MLTSNTALKFYILLPIAFIFALMFARFYPHPTESVHAETQMLDVSELSADDVKTKKSPSSISIPTLGLELPVAAGVVKENQWTLFEDKASWLSTSEEPGFGNIIIYAHNRPNLFGNLDDILVGDEIVLAHQGKPHFYKVNEVRKVTPDDIGAVLSSKNRLTLYTCDGAFDQKRLVVIAEPN